MKYIKKFTDHSLYQTYQLDHYNTPNVSKCILQNEIHYNSRIILPYDAEIEYLESSGTQHIITDLYGNNNLRFEVKFNLNSLKSPEDNVSATIFGSRVLATTNNYQLGTYGNGTVGFGDNLNSELTINQNYIDYTVKFENDNIYVNGNLVKTISVNKTFTTPTSLYIFALYHAGNITEHLRGKIYYIKFFDKTTLKTIAEYIPVRIGNEGYLYDKISKQLFSNSGTGNFILGPDI